MKKNIKGMIMSIEKECAIVLTPDGQFLKTKVKSGTRFIGDEISIDINERHWIWEQVEGLLSAFHRPVLQVALSLALVMVGGIGTWAYPAGHIYVDVNPSLGMSYNIYHRVIAMESFNEDGTKVIDKVSFYGKKVSEGVEETLKVMNSEGFIKNEAEGVSGVLIGYTDAKIEKEVLGSVLETSEKLNKTVQVASLKVASNAKNIAQEQKGQEDALSPIQAEIATRKVDKDNLDKNQDKNLNQKRDKKSKEVLKDEIKAAAKVLKEKTTAEIIDESRGEVNVIPNAKVDEINKRNQLKKDREKEQEKNKENDRGKNQKKPRVEVKKETRETPKKESITERRDNIKNKKNQSEATSEFVENQNPAKSIRLQHIIEEISKLNALVEEIQASEAKSNQKAAKIKKIMKRIQRLEEEKEELEDD